MFVSKLRWLSLLALIGLVGLATGSSGFFGFFGFLGFLSFNRSDERDEANAGRAALVAFSATLILAALTIAAIPLLAQYRQAMSLNMGNLLAYCLLAVAAIFASSLLSFLITYHYLDAKGR